MGDVRLAFGGMQNLDITVVGCNKNSIPFFTRVCNSFPNVSADRFAGERLASSLEVCPITSPFAKFATMKS